MNKTCFVITDAVKDMIFLIRPAFLILTLMLILLISCAPSPWGGRPPSRRSRTIDEMTSIDNSIKHITNTSHAINLDESLFIINVISINVLFVYSYYTIRLLSKEHPLFRQRYAFLRF